MSNKQYAYLTVMSVACVLLIVPLCLNSLAGLIPALATIMVAPVIVKSYLTERRLRRELQAWLEEAH